MDIIIFDTSVFIYSAVAKSTTKFISGGKEMNSDTINLLKECSSGCRMAENSINQIEEFVQNTELKDLLEAYKDEHLSIKEKIDNLLASDNKAGKEPGMMASAFAWITTEMKMNIKNDANQIAKIMMNGCNMGIQSLGENLTKYPEASNEAVLITKKLIRSEEEFHKKMEKFL